MKEQVLITLKLLLKHKMETRMEMMIIVPLVMTMKEQRVRKRSKKSRNSSPLLASLMMTSKQQISDKQI